jgi:hypothetical protein
VAVNVELYVPTNTSFGIVSTSGLGENNHVPGLPKPSPGAAGSATATRHPPAVSSALEPAQSCTIGAVAVFPDAGTTTGAGIVTDPVASECTPVVSCVILNTSFHPAPLPVSSVTENGVSVALDS